MLQEPRIASLQDKVDMLEKRQIAEKALVQQVDRALKIVDDDGDAGCSFCFILRRLRGFRSVAKFKPAATSDATSVEGAPTTAAGSAVVSNTASSARTALFGSKKKKADPTSKLQEAAAAMTERIRALEYRAIESKQEAARLAKQGQKPAALRALKKAKTLEQQMESNQAALDAVEQQVDMLAQAEVQKQLSTALTTSSAGLKNQKQLLKSAESAVDAAQDARDTADDLNSVLSEFAGSGSTYHDETDLLEELDQLVAASEPPAPPPPKEAMENPQAKAMRELEEKHRQYDEEERVRRSLPSVSRTKVTEEKTRLIAAAV